MVLQAVFYIPTKPCNRFNKIFGYVLFAIDFYCENHYNKIKTTKNGCSFLNSEESKKERYL